MRLLVYFNSLAPAGGIERVISEHIRLLTDRGFQIDVLTKDSTESFYDLPLTVDRSTLGIDFDLNMSSRVKRIFKISRNILRTASRLKHARALIEEDVSLVYVASPLNLLELYISGKSLKEVIVTEHSSYVSYNRVYKFIIKCLYSRVGLLTTPTTMDSMLYKKLGIDNEYLPNPLPFYPSKFSDLEEKTALNIARFTDDKRHSLLLNLWARSNARQQGWKLLIIGRGENKTNLENLIKELGLQDIVELKDVQKDIQEVYYKSSMFLLSSRNEGFGLVLVEAMACGVPCIAINCPSGPRDIIRDGIDGFLVEEGDHEQFITHMNELMLNKAMRSGLGMAARKGVMRFESDLIGNKLQALINAKFTENV